MAGDELFDARSVAGPGNKEAILRDVRAYRLARLQEQLLKHNVPAILLYDPVNIRYATDTSNMQVWAGRNPARYIMVFANGHIVAWEFHSSEHVWDGLNLDVEFRGAISWTFFNAGYEAERRAESWGAEIADVFRKHAPGERLLAVDRLDPFGTAYLEKSGITLLDGQVLMETARLIKSAGELVLMGESLRTAEKGIERMRRELRPGITENDLLVHDIYLKDPSVAFMLARMEQPEFPQPVGIFRAIERATYEDMMVDQIDAAVAKSGPGSLEKLINSGDIR